MYLRSSVLASSLPAYLPTYLPTYLTARCLTRNTIQAQREGIQRQLERDAAAHAHRNAIAGENQRLAEQQRRQRQPESGGIPKQEACTNEYFDKAFGVSAR
eukprot:GHVU01069255.1.p2 GENE.GHVU01069255.1~~GHVU01069255.1.p2  ORF type:complete len:101 (+),score=8.36 GHVU01069255.1:563-865(+)